MAGVKDIIDFAPPEKPAERVAVMRKFTCPNCGGEIQIRASGHTLMAVCAHCSSVIDVSDERVKVIEEVNTRVMKTFLEIGQRGVFDGVIFEIIGYVQKSDRTKVYYWEEYLLFNPYHGFRFLVHMDGHWNFVRVVKRDVDKPGFVCNVYVDDNKYQPFLQDQPIVQYVKGEFYWRVKKGDKARTEDYVCPPYMLSLEHDDGETTVSLCEYREPEEIKAAFLLDKDMPPRKGAGPNQPSPVNFGAVMKVAAVAAVILIVFHALNLSAADRQKVMEIAAVHNAGDQSKTFTSAAFEVSRRSNVLIESYANVSNSWVELNVSLVNETTKEIFEVAQPIEYYFGRDSDGSWSEGGTTASDYMSSVPPGWYRMVYDLDADAFRPRTGYKLGGPGNATPPADGKPVNVSIRATRDVPSWGNFWMTLLVFLLCPLYTAMRASTFENQRWANSDFPRGEE